MDNVRLFQGPGHDDVALQGVQQLLVMVAVHRQLGRRGNALDLDDDDPHASWSPKQRILKEHLLPSDNLASSRVR